MLTKPNSLGRSGIVARMIETLNGFSPSTNETSTTEGARMVLRIASPHTSPALICGELVRSRTPEVFKVATSLLRAQPRTTLRSLPPQASAARADVT